MHFRKCEIDTAICNNKMEFINCNFTCPRMLHVCAATTQLLRSYYAEYAAPFMSEICYAAFKLTKFCYAAFETPIFCYAAFSQYAEDLPKKSASDSSLAFTEL